MDKHIFCESPDFLSFVSSLSKLEEVASAAMKSKLYNRKYKKGELILEAGAVCKRIYFVKSGLVKTFFYADSREFIMRFFSEKNMFTVLDSFILQQPSTYSILAIEDCHLTCIDHNELETLSLDFHTIETFYRKLLALAAVNMMERIGSKLEEKAQIAYHKFLKENGALLQRISLADLASYLGITQVSLSRIRAIK
ncbi:Crp/Fnr family transcriptional regulator [Pedobacter agri]|uniref:Crp/Fnr family transcriptional regulator n=1 Tax=Pedobacter agri TaxID=454586 RepID=A0A9X3DCF3_9SPHI|nr:Crp/Fnr family transcriptional regulator [Pedobacter agri]MCX3264849.1 Crp/Fnr family transcriptional regulator [Pedobacter agri]